MQEIVSWSVVEAPFAFLEEEVEVLAGDAIVAAEMAFGLAPEVFDAVDVVALIGEALAVVDPEMVELGDVEDVVGAEAVAVDDAVGPDPLAHDAHESQ